jgi:hypothetical protein
MYGFKLNMFIIMSNKTSFMVLKFWYNNEIVGFEVLQ